MHDNTLLTQRRSGLSRVSSIAVGKETLHHFLLNLRTADCLVGEIQETHCGIRFVGKELHHGTHLLSLCCVRINLLEHGRVAK